MSSRSNCGLTRIYAKIFTEKIGRDDRIRTCDPHTPSVMRYQAALRPDRQCPRRGALEARLYGQCTAIASRYGRFAVASRTLK
jgi:hypothetical protein